MPGLGATVGRPADGLLFASVLCDFIPAISMAPRLSVRGCQGGILEVNAFSDVCFCTDDFREDVVSDGLSVARTSTVTAAAIILLPVCKR